MSLPRGGRRRRILSVYEEHHAGTVDLHGAEPFVLYRLYGRSVSDVTLQLPAGSFTVDAVGVLDELLAVSAEMRDLWQEAPRA